VFFGIIAIIEFVIAAALFSGKSWGRKVVIAFFIIDIILELFTLAAGSAFAVIFIILDIIVLYYIWRPHVREYFEGTSYNQRERSPLLKRQAIVCNAAVQSRFALISAKSAARS
jgi:hypothetical protein